MTVTPLRDSDGMALAPEITVGGAPLADVWIRALVEMRVELGVGTIGRATLRFVDDGYLLAEKGTMKVGATLVVSARGLAPNSPMSRVFRGSVTAAGVELREFGTPAPVVVATDAAYELARTSRVATYLDQQYRDVVQAVLSRAGITAKVDGTGETLPYLLQTDTDLGFLDEIARRIGFDWTMDDGTFHFWNSRKSESRATTLGKEVSLAPEYGLIEFSASVSADAPTKVTVRGWDAAAQSAIQAVKPLDRSAVPGGLTEAFSPASARTAERLTTDTNPGNAQEATALAGARSQAIGTVLARGRCTITPTLRPGVSVKLEAVGPASGSYFVQEVVHTYRPIGFDTRFVAGDRTRPRLSDAVAPGAAAQASFLHSGLVPAVVSDIKDKDDLGRVKVTFPWLDGQVASDWARVAMIGAGKERGFLVLPDVGDEVLVGFENGDSRRPVVIGGLVSKSSKFPSDLQDGKSVTKRRIRSARGHVVELGDGQGSADQYVLVALEDPKHQLRIGKDGTALEVPSGVKLRIAAGSAEILLDGNGKIELKGATIAITAQQALELSGLDVTIKATKKVAISGLQTEIKGSAQATIDGGGMTTVKGGMVQIN